MFTHTLAEWSREEGVAGDRRGGGGGVRGSFVPFEVAMAVSVMAGISTGLTDVTAANSGSNAAFLLREIAETCPTHTHTHTHTHKHTHTHTQTHIREKSHASIVDLE